MRIAVKSFRFRSNVIRRIFILFRCGCAPCWTARAQPLVAGCLDCEPPKVRFDATVLRGQAVIAKVFIHFSVKRDGTIGSIEIKGAPSHSIGEDVRKEIAGWLLAPAHEGTETIPQEKSMEFLISCFAGFPGHPETAMCNTLSGSAHAPAVTVISGTPN